MKIIRFCKAFACLSLIHFAEGTAGAKVVSASIFTDHAVLQHGRPVPVWGTADAGESVTVTYLEQSVKTTAASDGTWQVTLAPLKPSLNGELIIAGTNVITLKDVVTGDVWLASGQSNMAFPLKSTSSAAQDIAAANYPGIRCFNVVVNVSVPALDAAKGVWNPLTPQTAPNFSAVAYYFAIGLHKALGIPIGIIRSAKGGSPIEAWMSAEALAASGRGQIIARQWSDDVKAYPQNLQDYQNKTLPKWTQDAAAATAAGRPEPVKPGPPPGGPGDFRVPGGLYGGMIHPFIRYPIEGVIWYQGEANAAHYAGYGALLDALISDWRDKWGEKDLPFLFVQLPNLITPGQENSPTGGSWAGLRDQQTRALELPHTAMAVTIDLGDPNNIHPKNKHEVGERLALLARATVYGERLEASGPVIHSASPDGGTVRLTFDHAEGLATRGGGQPGGFQLAGADKVFHPASAVIDNDTVRVSSLDVTAPQAVRYAWKNNPVDANLVNAAGLPARPFQTPVNQ